MPSNEALARALELIAKGPAQYDYFFDNLEDPSEQLSNVVDDAT